MEPILTLAIAVLEDDARAIVHAAGGDGPDLPRRLAALLAEGLDQYGRDEAQWELADGGCRSWNPGAPVGPPAPGRRDAGALHAGAAADRWPCWRQVSGHGGACTGGRAQVSVGACTGGGRHKGLARALARVGAHR